MLNLEISIIPFLRDCLHSQITRVVYAHYITLFNVNCLFADEQ